MRLKSFEQIKDKESMHECIITPTLKRLKSNIKSCVMIQLRCERKVRTFPDSSWIVGRGEA